YKPTIVMQEELEASTGSARSVGEFDVLAAIQSASAHLLRFGGHKQAAGLTLKTPEYEDFYRAILDYAARHMPSENLQPQLAIEAELCAGQLSLACVGMLEQLAPFGVGNPRPKFLVRDLQISRQKIVGGQRQHLQLGFALDGQSLLAIMFNANDFVKTLKIGDTVDVACELIKDSWNGADQLKLRVIDVKSKRSEM
ncbi:MAG: hypothetical protein KGJ93_02150, partial [Patescibacteria group bacterium]|nr:hypothetical protein [Patescibacteria group bacterium]